MNRRQAKKAYKKKHGHNPPKPEIRFYPKYWAKKAKKAMVALPDIMQRFATAIRKMTEEVVKQIQTMPEEDFNKFLEEPELETSTRRLAIQIRAGRLLK